MVRFVLADYRVEFAHQFLNMMGLDTASIPLNKERTIEKDGKIIVSQRPNNLVHGECVDIYRSAIQNHIHPASDRIGNWAQPFRDGEDILRFIDAQFKDVERIKNLING